MSDRFVVHRVEAHELGAYLNGAPSHRSRSPGREYTEHAVEQVRPEHARIIGVFQEDVGNFGYRDGKETHEEYRVVWEREA